MFPSRSPLGEARHCVVTHCTPVNFCRDCTECAARSPDRPQEAALCGRVLLAALFRPWACETLREAAHWGPGRSRTRARHRKLPSPSGCYQAGRPACVSPRHRRGGRLASPRPDRGEKNAPQEMAAIQGHANILGPVSSSYCTMQAEMSEKRQSRHRKDRRTDVNHYQRRCDDPKLCLLVDAEHHRRRPGRADGRRRAPPCPSS